MKVCIDSDETGTPLMLWLISKLGSDYISDISEESAKQYPDIANRMGALIELGTYSRGILICGTGLGMAMMANKVSGVFAGTPQDPEAARHMARSNNAQVLTLGANHTTPEKAFEIVKAWLETPFEPRRNAARMRELENLNR